MDISGLSECELEALAYRQIVTQAASRKNLEVIEARLSELRQTVTEVTATNDAPDPEIADEVIDKE